MGSLPEIRPWKVFSGEHHDDNNTRRRPASKWQVVSVIVAVRMLYLLTMIVTCHFIPEHNPGDDVLRFNLRLLQQQPNGRGCFCLRGHSCDDVMSDASIAVGDCAIPASAGNATITVIAASTWNAILQPFTKWDAARFLHLALDPNVRDPSPKDGSASSTVVSEEAHAFLPLFPWMIRTTALSLLRRLPARVLPPTYEGLLVASGILFNNFLCLPISTLSLYELTRQLLVGGESVAVAVCWVFGIWNPASVFFATNYSESFFAMTTLLGHVAMQRSKRSEGMGEPSLLRWWWWTVGIGMWMMGSCTRSNGTIHSLWLLQDGLARLCRVYLEHRSLRRRLSKDRTSSWSMKWITLAIFMRTVVGAGLVALPVRYHDWQGYQRHCLQGGINRPHRPHWCLEKEGATFWYLPFSLYGYVQDKHWNVGLFRYYQWKQIPNFLLSAPILMLSFGAAAWWIYWSLVTEYGKGKMPSSLASVTEYGKGKMPSSLASVAWEWPIFALSDSIDSVQTMTVSPIKERLLKNPQLLSHYAILSVLATVGLVIAHVQISTRMICSSSPAIHWFLTYCMVHPNYGKIIWIYSLLFMFLGVVLHVNFLPWT